MGIFRQRVTVTNPATRQASQVECLVDTGSTYLWFPEDLLQALGVQPALWRRLRLATGEVIERPAAEVLVTLNGETLTVVCVFGDAGSDPLLGSLALETFSVAVDPVNKRLVPTISYLA
jgi:clan AA aspartic protease